jgi:DNA-binding MarR family transcriptional regulator
MRKGSPWALWTLNFNLSLSVMAEVAPSIRGLRVEMKEFFLLTALDDNPNPADLARALMTPKPTVTFMVKRMEAAGYIKRELEPDDLRRFRLTLTAPGRKAMEKARAIFEEAFGRRLARLTQAQRAELQRLLEQMSAPSEPAAAATSRSRGRW